MPLDLSANLCGCFLRHFPAPRGLSDMNTREFFTELKRRNVYKVSVAYGMWRGS